MKIKNIVIATLAAASVTLAWAQAPAHRMITDKDLKWEDVPSLPPGAKAAMIEGPMNEAVPFTVRIKVPNNYKVPPHFHPAVERVTVLKGAFAMGMGEKYDEKAMHTLKVGDMMIMQPKQPHYAMAKGETELQLHGMGPWGVTYVNEADDPRKKAGAAPKKDEKKK